MHKLVTRQLKKSYGKGFELSKEPIEFQKFCLLVSEAYDEFLNERRFMEHTLEMNSKELTDANRKISEKNRALQEKISTISLSKSFLNRLIDTVPIFILTLEADLKIVSSNAKFMDSTNELYEDFSSLFSDESMFKDFEKDCQALIKGDVEFIYNEMNLYDKFNNTLYIAWTHTIVENEEGRNIILSIGSDLTQHKEAEKAMQWMAFNDSLTNIGNRRDFQKNISHVLKTISEGAVVFIDVNHFKQINDVYGHNVGDQVLIDIANTLSKVTKDSDYISRLAGDEFTIILAHVNDNNIRQVLDRLLTALNGNIELKDGSELQYTVSIGASLFPLHSTQQEKLIVQADMAMYQAKKMGMGRWHVFDPEKDKVTTLHEDSRVIFCLNKAIEDSRMQLYYQPIFKLDEKRVSHYEVLIRMFDLSGKVVFPGSFIPAAERMGLIRDIDEWVLGHALQNLALHINSMPDLEFAVNISAPSLQAPDFPETLKQALADSGVSSRHLIIELTETAYIDNFEQVQKNLQKIHDLGVKIALDDFGVGFSSFSYLKKMPLTYVKLDGSYVKDLLNSDEDQIFVESVSKMVKAFGMQTIAEFVGNQASCQKLLELGVSYAQGFYIGQPQPHLATMEEIQNNIKN